MPRRLLYAPFLAQLVVTRRCNLACGYCNEYDHTSAPVPTALLLQRVDHLARLGALSVELTGGEPLLHPELDAVIRHARARRVPRVMLITNGFLLGRERIERLNDAGLQRLQISVDGVSPNDTTVKVMKSLRPKLEALARWARFRVTVSAVVGAAPLPEAAEVVRIARGLGLRARVLLVHDGRGAVALAQEALDGAPELAALLGAAWREAKGWRARVAQPGGAPFKCRAGARYLYIDELGVVRWCSQTRPLFGVPLPAYDHAWLRQQFHTEKPCSATCTVGCARTNSALDAWRGQWIRVHPTALEGTVGGARVGARR